MTERGRIISIKDGKIRVSPVQGEECSSCGAGCEKNQRTFIVSNPKKFPIKTGSLVEFQARERDKALQGLFSLFIPFLCAIAGFFIAPPLASCFGKTAGEGFKAFMVLFLLVLSGAIVLLITRRHPLPGTPEITAEIQE